MKNRLLNLVKKAIAPVALIVAMAAFNPVVAMAANRGGHEGARGERSYAAPSHGNFGGARSFSERGNLNRGNAFSEHRSNGDSRGSREFYGRGYYGGRGYYRPGFGFGVGVYPSYGYVAPVCDPAGFYDRYGNWQYYPGCATAPYPY